MPLTDADVRNAQPKEKQYRLADGGGMYLEVRPNGGRYWRLKYRFAGKEKALTLGAYPSVTLKEARAKREAAKKQLEHGVDPSMAKQAVKRTARLNAENTFEAVAREWHTKFAPTWSDGHAARILRRLEADAFPWLGRHLIADLKPLDVLDVLHRVEKRGALETAHRLRESIGQVMRHAVITQRAARDITIDLRGALPPAPTRHFPALTDPAKVAELLRAIDGYSGTLPVLCALRLAALLFQRPGELRHAEWSEFDLDGGTWEIPAAKMKRTKDYKTTGGNHIVPLATQAVAILRDLEPLTGSGRFVFPSVRTSDRPMSENTVNAALRRLGYDSDTMTGHGFRAMARTILHEGLEVSPEVIEAQLAHGKPDELGEAYNRTKFLRQRREMMQRWANYLDELKRGAKVIPMTDHVA